MEKKEKKLIKLDFVDVVKFSCTRKRRGRGQSQNLTKKENNDRIQLWSQNTYRILSGELVTFCFDDYIAVYDMEGLEKRIFKQKMALVRRLEMNWKKSGFLESYRLFIFKNGKQGFEYLKT